MPKLNGFSFIESIKNNPELRHIPVIVFSSVANNEQIDRLKELGITNYLNKIDTTPTQLVTIINQTLTQPPPKQ
jgi:CheY-like chemotaxis protein